MNNQNKFSEVGNLARIMKIYKNDYKNHCREGDFLNKRLQLFFKKMQSS